MLARMLPASLLALLLAPCLGFAAPPAPAAAYTPPPASAVPGYSEKALPCRIYASRDGQYSVGCNGRELRERSLTELSLQRNTIFARYGFTGFRKRWLREHFQKQPWYQPNPAFSNALLSEADRTNITFVLVAEMSLGPEDLQKREDTVYARRGKTWDDIPKWELRDGGTVRSCDPVPKARASSSNNGWAARVSYRGSKDCYFRDLGFKPDPQYLDKLIEEDRIELGLVSRAMGGFALDEGPAQAMSLDEVLSVKDLRQLSLRDLRLLRNTVFARRGRSFKSKLLQQHFNKMPWYKADPTYTDARLTENDKRNIALIRAVEDEFGGPLLESEGKRPKLKIPGAEVESPDLAV